MTPGIGTHNNNLLNLFKFSSCSIQAFKSLLLSEDKQSVSKHASCLTRSTLKLSKSIELFGKLPGHAFTADDQCKMIYGKTASFCHVIEQFSKFNKQIYFIKDFI